MKIRKPCLGLNSGRVRTNSSIPGPIDMPVAASKAGRTPSATLAHIIALALAMTAPFASRSANSRKRCFFTVTCTTSTTVHSPCRNVRATASVTAASNSDKERPRRAACTAPVDSSSTRATCVERWSAGSQALKGAKSRPSGTYHFRACGSHLAPSALTALRRTYSTAR